MQLIRQLWNGLKSTRHVVFTHDLDFGTMLALTHQAGPSVLQVRTQNVFPDHLKKLVIAAIHQRRNRLGIRER